MNSSIRRTLILAASLASLGASVSALAGTGGGARDAALERREQRQSQPAAEAAPQRQYPQAERSPRGPQPQVQGQGPRDRGPATANRPYRPQPGQAQAGAPRDRGGFRPSPGAGPAMRPDPNDHRNYHNGNIRPRVVQTLPRGYRNYNWNGRPYYSYGGSWYRPYGGSYISIGVPYGLFVSTLPGYSSSFWYGNSRYYYYDDTYYVYEPARRGYVVTRSPYNDDPVESSDEPALDDDLYIYPAKGQSEQQQSDDRYECHRWAADETKYDPLDDAYQPDDRADYLRAMTACLTGRGYSVK